MSENKRKRLAIIDGKSVFYRGYYAMPNLSTKEGIPTGGVYGFAVMALEVIKRLKPDYVCVAWDKPKTNIRKRLELYPAYKAGRKPPPADFYEQIPLLHELLDAFGWPLYELDDYEADDIMGTLATQATKQGIETMLVTSDMDMLQLVDGHVNVYALKTGLSNIELFHPESFEEKYGIRVNQFLDLKSLMGDSSDNIPGVPGIGKKGAVDLLKQFETLDEVYENTALVKDSIAKKLEAGKESAYLSKKLAAIWTDAPIKLDLAAVDGSKCSPERVAEQLKKLEFRTLLRQLPTYMHIEQGTEQKNNQTTNLLVGKMLDITEDEQLADVSLTKSNHIVLQTICSSSRQKKLEKIIIGFDTQTYVLDVAVLKVQSIKNFLGACFMVNPSVVGYDVKASLRALMTIGIPLPQVEHDVLIGAFLINSLRREQSLSELAAADLNIHLDETVASSADIVAVIIELYKQQVVELESMPKVKSLAQDIEWPVISVLAKMEHYGIQLDTQYLGLMAEQVDDLIGDLQQQIYGFADQEFNIASPSQLADILFEKLKLDTNGIKKGKTAYSTAASELDKLRGSHPIIDMITQFREVTKLKNTYIDTLPKLVDERSRVHTSFNLTIAQTGRLSSTDPNLQNIPVRTELGKRIRTAFVAGKGKLLVSADYSQFELRLAAVLANDKEMIDVFNRGVDIHTMTAAQVYGRDPEDVTKSMRRDAKVINFGVLYGMSPHGLSAATGMSFAQSKQFIDKYFEVRGPLLSYLNSLKELARTDGYVETLFGRRRPMPDIKSSNFMVRASAERAAMNMPIQGTEADLMKMAMIAVQQKLDNWSIERSIDMMPKQLLQVHDSILVECMEDDAKEVAQMLKTEMEDIYSLPVKLDVDVTIGENWGEL
jgi:DNA polymerase I